VRGGVPCGLTRVRGPGQLGAVGREHDRAHRNVPGRRSGRSVQRDPNQFLVVAQPHLTQFVQRSGPHIVEPEALCDLLELFVGIEIRLGEDHGQHGFR